eukprot:scaffold1350_cov56-Cyclotella_meneghiniana.AAC.4
MGIFFSAEMASLPQEMEIHAAIVKCLDRAVLDANGMSAAAMALLTPSWNWKRKSWMLLNNPDSGRTLTQHGQMSTTADFPSQAMIAISFHSTNLSIKQTQTTILGEQALTLTVRCLNCDFIGTNPDESTEERRGSHIHA